MNVSYFEASLRKTRSRLESRWSADKQASLVSPALMYKREPQWIYIEITQLNFSFAFVRKTRFAALRGGRGRTNKSPIYSEQRISKLTWNDPTREQGSEPKVCIWNDRQGKHGTEMDLIKNSQGFLGGPLATQGLALKRLRPIGLLLAQTCFDLVQLLGKVSLFRAFASTCRPTST